VGDPPAGRCKRRRAFLHATLRFSTVCSGRETTILPPIKKRVDSTSLERLSAVQV
jgi:hypothetical protein